MFRQFLVHEQDVDWQRILWRRSSDVPIDTFRLTTVTYGTACAPFLSNACMLRLADLEQTNFPKTAEVFRKSRYADDFFAGGDTLEEAAEVKQQLVDILASAGMSVGKWAANNSKLLSDLESSQDGVIGASIAEQDAISMLGLRWISSEDSFYFKVASIELGSKVSKRSMLSEIARLFDHTYVQYN